MAHPHVVSPFLGVLGSAGLLLSIASCGSLFPTDSSPDGSSARDAAVTTGTISHGIATGDVTSHSALVWLRTDGRAQVEVRWAPASEWTQSASSPTAPPSAKRERGATASDHDFTLKIALEGLRAATRYRYEVRSVDAISSPDVQKEAVLGEFTTAPGSETSIPVRLLWSADLGGQRRCRDEESGYPIFDVMREQKPDFALLLGDLIHADDICPSPPNAPGIPSPHRR